MNLLVTILFSLILLGCFHKEYPVKSSGSFVHQFKYFDTTTKTFRSPTLAGSTRYWYLDSFIVSEGYGSSFSTRNGKLQSWNTYIDRYTFMDLRTNKFYVYNSFSDTASLRSKFDLSTPGRPNDIWDLSKDICIFKVENTQEISDTIIHSIRYKRLVTNGIKKDTQSSNATKEYKFQRIGYARPDRADLLISLDRITSKRIKMPIVRIDYWVPELKISQILELNISQNQLNNKELDILKKWIQKSDSDNK